MTRTYRHRTAGERYVTLHLTCDRCAVRLRFPVPTDPARWPLHRCTATGRPAPFTRATTTDGAR